jgi:hypothetical protein
VTETDGQSERPAILEGEQHIVTETEELPGQQFISDLAEIYAAA